MEKCSFEQVNFYVKMFLALFHFLLCIFEYLYNPLQKKIGTKSFFVISSWSVVVVIKAKWVIPFRVWYFKAYN